MKKLAVNLIMISVLSVSLFGGLYSTVNARHDLKVNQTFTAAAGSKNIFLPIMLRNYMTPRPLKQFGTALIRNPFTEYDSFGIAAMRFGWYVDFKVTPNAPVSYGIEYVPIVRVKQYKLAPDGKSSKLCCVSCTQYVTPSAYTVLPSISQIRSMAISRPGLTWVIGNEMERRDWGSDTSCSKQDEMLPELYAQAYHDIYTAIKAVDSTAQVAIGGMVEFTPLRQKYLDRVWAEYSSRYGQTMPVDVWNIHLYALPENSCVAHPGNCWGAEIPAGLSETSGAQYTVKDNKNFSKVWAQIVSLRTWMKNHGQKDKPLITTEYGVNFPDSYVCDDNTNCFSAEQVRDSMMYPSFDAFLNQTDATIGDSLDGNRLLQRWNWWSADFDNGKCDTGSAVYEQFFGGTLFYSGAGPSVPQPGCNYPARGIAPLGTYWKQYVQSLP